MNERDDTTVTRTTTTTTTTNATDTPVVRDDMDTARDDATMNKTGDVKMAGTTAPTGNAKMAGATAPSGNPIGMTVNDAGGETIGTIAEYNEQEGYLVVMGGWLFAKNTRMPLDAIGDRGASGLYTTASKDQLLEQYGDEQDREHAEEIANQARTAIPDQSMAESGATPQLSDVNVPDEEERGGAATTGRTTPMG